MKKLYLMMIKEKVCIIYIPIIPVKVIIHSGKTYR